MTDHPHSNFVKYIGTDFQPFILPIIPVDAQLSDKSKLKPELLGKIPGLYNRQTKKWAGTDWTGIRATPALLQLWQEQQKETGATAIGLITGEVVVIDIDCDKAEIVARIRRIAEKHFGPIEVVRTRDGSVRIQLFYAHKPNTPPITKLHSSYKDAEGNKFLVEVLGRGQQTVIEGPHAKGAMHHWENDQGLVEAGWTMPFVTIDQAITFKQAVDAEFTELGFERVSSSRGSGYTGDHSKAVSITNLMSEHIATDRDMLVRAMYAIDLDHPDYNYDYFIALLRAICAAVAGDMEFFAEVVWPWVCTNQKEAHGAGPRTEEAGVEWLETRWRSFKDSEIGARYVYERAAEFGNMEGLNADATAIFAAAGALDDAEAGDGGSDGSAVAAGSPTGSGPTAFPHTDIAIAYLFTAQNPDWRYTPDEGWMRLKSGVYVPDPTILHPIGNLCSAVGDPYRAQGPQGAKIDIMLKSTGKHQSVERRLRSHPNIFAAREDFDTDPWMLNTPEFIIDLRTGQTHAHGALMRNQTAVTPDLLAWNDYERACPRFLELLHHLVEVDDDVALLGRHGAAGLVGTDLYQYMLFMHGPGGTGKSAFSDICMRVNGRYSTSATSTLLMKQADKRPFELGDIVHARSLFIPETLRGMSWDDALICALLGGVQIRVERKGRDSWPANVYMTITVTGNHLPVFITSSQPNKSGIDRRLLLVHANKLIKGTPDAHFSRKLVAEEGPAILMFFIQHAMEGYQSLVQNGSFYGNTVNHAKAAAQFYKQRLSPHLAWIEDEDIVIEHGARMNAHQAWRSYKEWVKDDNPTHRETKQEFRDNLKAISGGQITYGRFGFERVFFGMRFKKEHQGENVVPFPTVNAEQINPAAEEDEGGDAKK
jgi:putative DNA primase/helicase